MPESLMTHMVAYYPDRKGSLEVARAFVDGGAAYLWMDPSSRRPVRKPSTPDSAWRMVSLWSGISAALPADLSLS